jgi:DNA repair photolyase
MIQEIQAKTLLGTVRGDDTLFQLKYNLNLYRGCEHQCIYCDSRSECYGIENFNDILVKVNAIDLLKKELPSKRVKGPIGFGSMSDPYTPTELQYNLTSQALDVIASHNFPVLLITKSDLVLKDLDRLAAIQQATRAVVCFTLTTVRDDLAKKVEPGAPPPSARLQAMQALAKRGILTGVTLMPILPFIEDSWEDVSAIIRQTAQHGGSFILPGFGMTQRNRQRDYYYAKLDVLFPGLRQKYEQRFGNQYSCPALNVRDLYQRFKVLCKELDLATHLAPYQMPAVPEQLSLF